MSDRKLPPHMQHLLQERSRSIDEPQGDAESRRAALERRRMAIQFDIDQGELAMQPENPWTHRIELLTEALANVESELAATRNVKPSPFFPVPELPITDILVTEREPYEVEFTIDGQRFSWLEKLDWEERGGLLAQPVLEQMAGNAHTLVPSDVPELLRDDLTAHLINAVSSLAVAIRDARLNEDDLPVVNTLADLAIPCPVCGGWTDALGHCNACAHRKAAEQELFLERQHLMRERAAEAEERHRLSERLPLARRRMDDLERELASL